MSHTEEITIEYLKLREYKWREEILGKQRYMGLLTS
jgi:hypothetical protein